MLATSLDDLKARADKLAELIAAVTPTVKTEVRSSQSYLGSGSLPTEAIASFELLVFRPRRSASELARRLRLDEACIFGRIQEDRVRLDVRTLTDEQLPQIAAALGRIAK